MNQTTAAATTSVANVLGYFFKIPIFKSPRYQRENFVLKKLKIIIN